jgi:hypothetical protein
MPDGGRCERSVPRRWPSGCSPDTLDAQAKLWLSASRANTSRHGILCVSGERRRAAMRFRVLTRSFSLLTLAALLAVMLAMPGFAQHRDHGHGYPQSREWHGGRSYGAADTTTIPEQLSAAFCSVSASGCWVELSSRRRRSCTHHHLATPIRMRRHRRYIMATDPPRSRYTAAENGTKMRSYLNISVALLAATLSLPVAALAQNPPASPKQTTQSETQRLRDRRRPIAWNSALWICTRGCTSHRMSKCSGTSSLK